MRIRVSEIKPGDIIFDPFSKSEIRVETVEPLNVFTVVNKSDEMVFFAKGEQVNLLGEL